MKYDFDTVWERRGSCSVKWDLSKENQILPMWVADMDFKTSPAIIEALENRVKAGIFGYSFPSEAFYEALMQWFKRRHNTSLNRDWLLYTTGVVPAISAIIRALTVKGDKVLIQEPVYNCFFSSIRNNECEIVSNNLRLINGKYDMDFDDLERKLADPKVKVFLLCSPHNPSGRIWEKEELQTVGKLCLKHNVVVVSDEIHCDLNLSNKKHTSFASLSNDIVQNSIICASPSKTFNLAGLHVANIIAPNELFRKKIDKALNINEVCEISPFAIDAQIAAYNLSEEWLDELLIYLKDNFAFLKEFFKSEFPNLSVLEMDATYLPWIDCHSLKIPSNEIAKSLYKKSKLWINAGTLYGENGEGFIRMNIACPRSILAEGLNRLKGINR